MRLGFADRDAQADQQPSLPGRLPRIAQGEQGVIALGFNCRANVRIFGSAIVSIFSLLINLGGLTLLDPK